MSSHLSSLFSSSSSSSCTCGEKSLFPESGSGRDESRVVETVGMDASSSMLDAKRSARANFFF